MSITWKLHLSCLEEAREQLKKEIKWGLSSWSSEAWYVGYTEDSESVEAIMKKFEELDKLQQEVSKENEDPNVTVFI